MAGIQSLLVLNGLYLAILISILEIIQATIKMFVGEIRISRLIYSIVQIYVFVSSLILVILYPYDLAGFFPTVVHPTGRTIVNFIQGLTSRPDYYFKILIGIAAVSSLMDAFYNLGKFGKWKPSHQKSLTIKTSEVAN